MANSKNVLFVTATAAEAAGFGLLKTTSANDGNIAVPVSVGGLTGTLLITGVGITATAFALGRHLSANHYDLAINLGIAGSFIPELPPGTVVQVSSDRFADLGAEDHDRFLSVFDLGFESAESWPFRGGALYADAAADLLPKDLIEVAGITVNTVHGNKRSIESCRELYPDAMVESMEGAAFYYSCLLSNQPCVQVRSISNYVEPRNRESWKIPEAMQAMSRVVQNWIPLMQSV